MRDSFFPCVITIAGSDSGGGAGIQADLKTFAALEVFGTCVVTAVTAQNTLKVSEIHPVPPSIISEQIKTIIEDIPISHAKVGMIYSSEAAIAIAEAVDRYDLKIVLDPVFMAGSGYPLIRDEAIKKLREELIPRSLVLTPNILEAQNLAGMEIRNIEEVEDASERISKLGVETILLKGGHFEGATVKDVLYLKGRFKTFEKPRVKLKFHGTGCTLSSAITAYLAKGFDLEESVEKAEIFMRRAAECSFPIGKGRVPINQMANLYKEADMWRVLHNVSEAVEKIEKLHEIACYIPEVGIQVGMAAYCATDSTHVAAVEGRIFKIRGVPKAMGRVWFDVSRHIANVALTAMKYDPSMRAAMNLRYDKKLMEAFRKLGYSISSFDRALEPPDVKLREGGTLAWGVGECIKSAGKVPDLIFDLGEVGKEPMMRILGVSAKDVVEKVGKALKILR